MSPQERSLAQLLQNMVRYFDLSELRALSFDLGVDWDVLTGDSKPTKVISLVTYLARRERIEELIAQLQEERPKVEWPPASAISLPETDIAYFLAGQDTSASQDARSGNIVKATRGGNIKVNNAITQEGDKVTDNIVEADSDGEIEAGQISQRRGKK